MTRYALTIDGKPALTTRTFDVLNPADESVVAAVAAGYARRLECGTAWVNQHGTLHPLAPFEGVKSAGIGVEFNVDGLRGYTTVQVVNVARQARRADLGGGAPRPLSAVGTPR